MDSAGHLEDVLVAAPTPAEAARKAARALEGDGIATVERFVSVRQVELGRFSVVALTSGTGRLPAELEP